MPIVLCSSGFCTMQYQDCIGDGAMCMEFADISELAMLIHCLGNQILQHADNPSKHLLLIDSLSHIEP